jgi:hypothetical protein
MANSATVSASATLTEFGPTSSITLSVDPFSIPADGTSNSTALATVKDSNGDGVANAAVTFGTNGDVTFGSVTNRGDGTYTIPITASKTADMETIFASTAGRTASASLTEFGPATSVSVALNPSSIIADGVAQSTATATVKDANNFGVTNEAVAFSTSGDVKISSAINNGNGTYTATITASKTPDTETITAKATKANVSGSALLTETAGPAATVSLSVTPSSIPADGTSQSTATAMVKDASGNPVTDENVKFSSNGDVTVGPVTNNGDGTYTTTITASRTADTETITATAIKAGKTGTATLTETPVPPTWSGWTGLAPPPVGLATPPSAPTVSSWGPGRLDLFAQGKDNNLWHRWTTDGGSSWSAWENLGAPPGGVVDSPGAVSWGINRVDVFVRGSDNALWHKWWDGASWNGWERLGGVLTSAPAVSSWASGRLDVFVKGSDDALWHLWWDGASWNGWESRGGVGRFAPAAASWGPGRIDLFTVGTDAGLWHQSFDGGQWSGWAVEVAGTFASGPGTSSWGPGRLDVFAASTTPGNPMTHAWFDGAWHTESLGGQLDSAPGAVSWGAPRIDTFVQGTDGNIWHNWRS